MSDKSIGGGGFGNGGEKAGGHSAEKKRGSVKAVGAGRGVASDLCVRGWPLDATRRPARLLPRFGLADWALDDGGLRLMTVDAPRYKDETGGFALCRAAGAAGAARSTGALAGGTASRGAVEPGSAALGREHPLLPSSDPQGGVAVCSRDSAGGEGRGGVASMPFGGEGAGTTDTDGVSDWPGTRSAGAARSKGRCAASGGIAGEAALRCAAASAAVGFASSSIG
ncbi:MAG TPA: hypothetical protein VL635_18025 [Trinickia sp.]|nr:hypothetical protein [Trinickia sp.]